MSMAGCLKNGHPRAQVVCDFIASITDRHALGLYQKIFFPSPTV
jgi:dGTPase